MSQLSKDLKGILWSRKPSSLDLKKDKNYIIHQVLAYGSLEQIRWVFKTFPKKEVTEVFLTSPRKNYTPAAFNYVKNFVLGLKEKEVDPKAYVKNLS